MNQRHIDSPVPGARPPGRAPLPTARGIRRAGHAAPLAAILFAGASCGAGAEGAGPRSARIALRTGPTLEYVQRGPDSGRPVLLLHGYTDSSASFERILPLLPPHLRLLAVDQRGHGGSTADMPGHAMADFAADVVAFLDALGIERATIVGHSMGGLVAQKVAMWYPQRVERLVLIGSMVRGGNPATLGMGDELRRQGDTIDPAFAREFQRSTLHAPVPEEFFERMVAQSLRVPARVWRQVAEDFLEQDTTAGLASITAPTLILWGDQDALFPREDQEMLDAKIADSTLQVLPGVGHAPPWESPEAVAAAIAAFLQGSEVPAAR